MTVLQGSDLWMQHHLMTLVGALKAPRHQRECIKRTAFLTRYGRIEWDRAERFPLSELRLVLEAVSELIREERTSNPLPTGDD